VSAKLESGTKLALICAIVPVRLTFRVLFDPIVAPPATVPMLMVPLLACGIESCTKLTFLSGSLTDKPGISKGVFIGVNWASGTVLTGGAVIVKLIVLGV
jgi:hypothetical protein